MKKQFDFKYLRKDKVNIISLVQHVSQICSGSQNMLHKADDVRNVHSGITDPYRYDKSVNTTNHLCTLASIRHKVIRLF